MWVLYTTATGAQISLHTDAEPVPLQGQSVAEVPDALQFGAMVWNPQTHSVIEAPTLTSEEFVRCFTDAEVSAMFAAAIALPTAWVAKAIALTCARSTIVLAHPEVVATIDGLVAIGILTAPRALRVKAGLPPL